MIIIIIIVIIMYFFKDPDWEQPLKIMYDKLSPDIFVYTNGVL